MEAFNLRSPAQVQEFLLSQGWRPVEWNYKKVDGKKVRTSPRLTEESFASIEGESGQMIARIRQLNSRLDFMRGLLRNVREDGRIPTPYHGKAVTHRLRHAVVVNVPSPEPDKFYGWECREVFIAEEGKVLVGCDSDGCQIRMLIHELEARGIGNEEFKRGELFGRKEDGTDTHSRNAVAVNRIVGEEVLTRTHAKNVFYGTIFGGGIPRIAALIGCSDPLAKRVRESFFEVLPELPELKQYLQAELRRDGYVRGIDGRPIYIRSPHMVTVSLMQGDEAIAMEMSMVYADKLIHGRGLDAHQLIYYHDELDWEASQIGAEEVGQCLEKAIAWPSSYLGLNIELTGSASIGDTWAEIH